MMTALAIAGAALVVIVIVLEARATPIEYWREVEDHPHARMRRCLSHTSRTPARPHDGWLDR